MMIIIINTIPDDDGDGDGDAENNRSDHLNLTKKKKISFDKELLNHSGFSSLLGLLFRHVDGHHHYHHHHHHHHHR